MTDQELKSMIKNSFEISKYLLCKFIKMAKEHKEKRESQ